MLLCIFPGTELRGRGRAAAEVNLTVRTRKKGRKILSYTKNVPRWEMKVKAQMLLLSSKAVCYCSTGRSRNYEERREKNSLSCCDTKEWARRTSRLQFREFADFHPHSAARPSLMSCRQPTILWSWQEAAAACKNKRRKVNFLFRRKEWKIHAARESPVSFFLFLFDATAAATLESALTAKTRKEDLKCTKYWKRQNMTTWRLFFLPFQLFAASDDARGHSTSSIRRLESVSSMRMHPFFLSESWDEKLYIVS